LQREQQVTTARWCKYGGTDEEAVWALNLEHDPLHVLLCGLFDRPSPTLKWVRSGYQDGAHPSRHDDAVGWEESLVLEVARWLNGGGYGETMRVLWWMGVCPDKLRASLEERLGRNTGEEG
jgi:hypothetical protein